MNDTISKSTFNSGSGGTSTRSESHMALKQESRMDPSEVVVYMASTTEEDGGGSRAIRFMDLNLKNDRVAQGS